VNVIASVFRSAVATRLVEGDAPKAPVGEHPNVLLQMRRAIDNAAASAR